MNKSKYKNWAKLNVAMKDLATFKPNDNTFLYIDNLFDDYLYQSELYEWWDTLFKFHSQCVEHRDNVRFILTINDKVMKKAGIFIDTEKRKETFFLQADSDLLKLSQEEKVKIFESQIKFAKEKKKINKNPQCIKGIMQSKLKDVKCPIGFPLCAHMYAFENDDSERDLSIFDHPRKYVRDRIKREINNGNQNDVRSLLLLLLFYSHPTGLHSDVNFQSYLKDRESCEKFLKNCSSVDVIKKMDLSFDKLDEAAKALNGSLLIEHEHVYEFKHNIYMSGVCDYFFLHYFDFAVKYFPLDLLRISELYDLSEEKLNTLRERLKDDINRQAFSKVLDCAILGNPSFEESLCDALKKDESFKLKFLFPDATSVFRFPMIFWASKYNLLKLQKLLLDWALNSEGDHRLQCYLALLGMCCGDDENYIKCVPCPLNNKEEQTLQNKEEQTLQNNELQNAVNKYKNSRGQSILHILISSSMSDVIAHSFCTMLLSESNDVNLKEHKNLLDCLLTQSKHSRLMCLLEILNRLDINQNQAIGHSNYIVKMLDDSTADLYWKLERLCRICIIVVYGMESFTEITSKKFFNNTASSDEEINLSVNDRMKNKMADRINECLRNVKGSCSDICTKMPCILNMTPKLEEAIKASILRLGTREETMRYD